MKKLEDLTVKEIEEYLEEEKAKVCEIKTPLKMGSNYLIRTVTMIYTGRLVKIYPNELVLLKAAWIPETERWANTVKDGVFKEVEPYPESWEVIVPRGGILDMVAVPWELPTKQK